MEITRRFLSRPIVAQFKPRHTLATNESYSEFQISGENNHILCFWSKGATRCFILKESEFRGRLNIAATI
jgi:hypothetical protein